MSVTSCFRQVDKRVAFSSKAARLSVAEQRLWPSFSPILITQHSAKPCNMRATCTIDATQNLSPHGKPLLPQEMLNTADARRQQQFKFALRC